MTNDPIVAEVRRAREELAKRFNYDLHAIVEDARERTRASGRTVVSLAPKKPVGHPVPAVITTE